VTERSTACAPTWPRQANEGEATSVFPVVLEAHLELGA
jgi:hypothetical protein